MTPLKLNSVHTSSAAGEKDQLTVNVYVDGELRALTGQGNGPINAFTNALNELVESEQAAGNPAYETRRDVRVLDYAEHALSAGGDAIAAAYVESAVDGQVLWGVGLDAEHRRSLIGFRISASNDSVCTRVYFSSDKKIEFPLLVSGAIAVQRWPVSTANNFAANYHRSIQAWH